MAAFGSPRQTIHMIAAGKAAWPMSQAAIAAFGERVTAAVVAGPHGHGTLPAHLEWIDAGHPLPDDQSVRAAGRALELASAAGAGHRVLLVLLSGGGSAMLAAPAEGLALEDKQRTTDAMLRAGADIGRLNCVRKHLSRIKGGWLGLAAGRCQALALSDVHVPQDDAATIASGPTVADASTYEDALAAIDQLDCEAPSAVRRHLERGAAGEIPETPKPGDERLAQSAFAIVGNRHTAMHGAALEAGRRGYAVRVVEPPTQGPAREAGRWFARLATGTGLLTGRLCVIASGETTVTVRGDGHGGRNQEFVLGAARLLADGSRPTLVASVGTDGVDGPTDAAGAIATSTTLVRAAGLGFDLEAALERNDAYPLLAGLGDLITWGPTLTNVGDVHVLLTIRP
jgi:glycerate-2-kinase